MLAGIAQLEEQLFCKQQVPGSNPCAGTILDKLLCIDIHL